jgi:hypothetical protein
MIRTFALIAAVSTLALTASSAGAAQKPKAQDSSRETAIRECNAARAGYSQGGWGVRSDAIYRSCMAGRGQPE